MGGGGAMRTAAKVAGINVFTNSFRGGASAENPVTVAARKAARQVSTGVVSISSTGEMNTDQPIQKPAWEFDDWELAGSDDEFVVDRINTNTPRRVFGPVPTLEEAKEATAELKDALDKVYFSSSQSCGTGESMSDAHETKACISHESSVSNSALQAYKLFKQSPAAQKVVASIASDPNVWNAVMQNSTLVEFIELNRKSTNDESLKLDSKEFSESSVDSSDSNKSGEPDGLKAVFENVKVTVGDVVQYLTNMVESWFSSPKVGQREGYGDEKASQSYFAGGSFMALAMMVIMVVVLKR